MIHRELADLCRQSYRTPDLGQRILGPGHTLAILRDQDDGAPPVVIFGGTADALGWAINLQAVMVPGPAGRVHAGFSKAWQGLRRRLRLLLGRRQGVILAGHSQGGALATLAALDLEDQVGQLVTFGSPRVGDAEFAGAVAALPAAIQRYVYRRDPVPWVPGILAGFKHVCQATWYDGTAWRRGFSLVGLAPIVARLLTGGAAAAVRGLAADHEIDRYCEALAPCPDSSPC